MDDKAKSALIRLRSSGPIHILDDVFRHSKRFLRQPLKLFHHD